MPTHENDDPEMLLSQIARTEPWEFPEEFTRFKDAVDDQVAVMNRSRAVLMEPGVFECSACEKAVECSDAIVRYLRDANLDAKFEDLRRQIDSHNQAICEARNVRLPGDRLDKESVDRIMDATEPLDLVVPGLGTVVGVAGVVGANLVSRMLAGHRKEVARQEYDRITRIVYEGNIDPKLPSAPDINGIWPQEDPGAGGSGSSGLRGTWTDAPAVPLPPGVAGAAGRAFSLGGVPLPPRPGVSATGGTSGDGGHGGATANANANTNTGTGSTGNGGTTHGATIGTDTTANTGGRRQTVGHGQQGGGKDARDTRYTRDAYDTAGSHDADGIRYAGGVDGRHAGDMAVDGGMDGVWDAGGGRTAFTAGAGMGMGVGAAGMLATRRMGAAAGGVGVGAGMSAVPGAGVESLSASGAAGVGSYYANTPVKASVVSSSIKGATGMAAGLRKGELARAAAAEAGASGRNATPGMMGAANAGSQDKKTRRRNTMGYIAPTIEEDEEFTPKPLAAMAGHIKNLDK